MKPNRHSSQAVSLPSQKHQGVEGFRNECRVTELVCRRAKFSFEPKPILETGREAWGRQEERKKVEGKFFFSKGTGLLQ